MTWPRKLSLCPNDSPHPRTRIRRAPARCSSHSEGFHSWTSPELCVIKKLSKTKAIPFEAFIFPLHVTVECCNTAVGNPEGEKKKKRTRKCKSKILGGFFEVSACKLNTKLSAEHAYQTQGVTRSGRIKEPTKLHL